MVSNPAGDEHMADQAKRLSEMALYSTLEAGAITPGLIMTRNITDVEEAYKLFEEVREHSMAHLWDRIKGLSGEAPTLTP